MAENLETKRKFLLALSSPESQQTLKKLIEEHISRTSIIFAEDGLNAIQKIENDPPNVLVIQNELAKMSGAEVVKAVLRQNKAPISIILLQAIPEDEEEFVDQVAVGQVQYLDPKDLNEEIGHCLAKALNWLVRGDQFDFRLKFLSAGDVLLRQGEKAEYVYILKRGEMDASVHQSGAEVFVGKIEAQEFVGEMAYISGENRSADVIASTDCELIEIPIHHLNHLLFQKPAWSKALMKTLSKRVKTANQTIIGRTDGPV